MQNMTQFSQQFLTLLLQGQHGSKEAVSHIGIKLDIRRTLQEYFFKKMLY